MSSSGKPETIQVTAGADLSGAASLYKAIAVGGTIAAANNATIGLLQNKPKSGEDATLGYKGHMKGVAGAAITAGLNLKVTTSGFLIVVVSADGSCGKALSTAASGATVEGLFDFSMARTSFIAL